MGRKLNGKQKHNHNIDCNYSDTYSYDWNNSTASVR